MYKYSVHHKYIKFVAIVVIVSRDFPPDDFKAVLLMHRETYFIFAYLSHNWSPSLTVIIFENFPIDFPYILFTISCIPWKNRHCTKCAVFLFMLKMKEVGSSCSRV